MAESTEAVVLRRRDYSETSLLLWFYTPRFGQLRALAKGAKRPKGKFPSGLDLLTRNHIVLARSASGGLATLIESTLLDDYRPLRSDLDRLLRAQYCLELILLLTTEDDPNEPLYHLLVRTLERLASGRGHPAAHTIRFEIGTLAATGYQIDWWRCVSCGRPLGQREGGHLSPSAGGVVCTACGGGVREKIPLAPGVLAAARLLSSEARRAELLRLADHQVQPLGSALGRYITYLVGRPPKMLKYLAAGGSGGTAPSTSSQPPPPTGPPHPRDRDRTRRSPE